MWKLMSVLSLVFVLAACQGERGSSGNARGPIPPANPAPGPVAEKSWGQLNCQPRRGCQNPVLNESKAELMNFLESQFANPIQAQDSDYAVFECGHRAENLWATNFGEDKTLQQGQWLEIGHFLMQVLDPKSCTLKANLEGTLQSYFEQTKEFKDEVE